MKNGCAVIILVLMGALISISTAQITFSRSWVPQGKRSVSQDAPTFRSLGMSPHIEVEGMREAVREARLSALTQVAANVADLIEEISNESSLALRLKNALSTR